MIIFVILLQVFTANSLDGVTIQFNKRGKKKQNNQIEIQSLPWHTIAW